MQLLREILVVVFLMESSVLTQFFFGKRSQLDPKNKHGVNEETISSIEIYLPR